MTFLHDTSQISSMIFSAKMAKNIWNIIVINFLFSLFVTSLLSLRLMYKADRKSDELERDMVNEELGFNLMFTTNSMELENYPLEFEKPLPTWLKGTLVGSFHLKNVGHVSLTLSTCIHNMLQVPEISPGP